MITGEELKATMIEAWNLAEYYKQISEKHGFATVDFYGFAICAHINPRLDVDTITIYENPNAFALGNSYCFIYNDSLLNGESDDILEHLAAILAARFDEREC